MNLESIKTQITEFHADLEVRAAAINGNPALVNVNVPAIDVLETLDEMATYKVVPALKKLQDALNFAARRIADEEEMLEKIESGNIAPDFEYEAKSQSPVPPVSDSEMESWRASAKVWNADPQVNGEDE